MDRVPPSYHLKNNEHDEVSQKNRFNKAKNSHCINNQYFKEYVDYYLVYSLASSIL